MTARLVWGSRDAIGPLMLGVALASYVALGVAVSCSHQAIPPNAPVGDCLSVRAEKQAKCVLDFGTAQEIGACQHGVRAAIDCTTEAGVWASEQELLRRAAPVDGGAP